ncbi:hypothetical protein NWFMUON74_68370 [Nocardia wallacei]|uniref:Uncharacterized protein n=1 Tax=Nocardia wallacei TaxID=480035 RepID=A0A7G1KUW6_9NOCA|nr:hypothetical protein NWFMUON74_68370 [Nocardia wallacei]
MRPACPTAHCPVYGPALPVSCPTPDTAKGPVTGSHRPLRGIKAAWDFRPAAL